MEQEINDLPVAEHPYAKELAKNLQTQKNMLTLLERKSLLLKDEVKLLSDELSKLVNERYKNDGEMKQETPESIYEAVALRRHELDVVEKKIQIIRVDGEILVLNKVITEKENYYRGYMAQFTVDVEDMQKHYRHTVDIAKKSMNKNIIALLNTVIWERVEEDDEKKIALYKQLRKYI